MNSATSFAAGLAVMVLMASAYSRAEGDAAAGAEKTLLCEGCHGVPGFRTAYPEVYSVPKLGGQSAAYIVKALQDYRSGIRTHPSMNSVAASLSDQDMADLAAYYARASAK